MIQYAQRFIITIITTVCRKHNHNHNHKVMTGYDQLHAIDTPTHSVTVVSVCVPRQQMPICVKLVLRVAVRPYRFNDVVVIWDS